MSDKKGKRDVASIPALRGGGGREGSGRMETFIATQGIYRAQFSSLEIALDFTSAARMNGVRIGSEGSNLPSFTYMKSLHQKC